MRLWLIRKLADSIDGIDLSRHRVGDMIDLLGRDAQLLLAEGWAVVERRGQTCARVLAFRRANLGHASRERAETLIAMSEPSPVPESR